MGKLISARKGLSEIAEKEHIDDVDLSVIRSYKKTADEIYEQHLYRLKKNNFDEDISKITDDIIIAFEANKLSIFAETIEIVSRMKTNKPIEQIYELIVKLKKTYEQSFYFNSESTIEEICLPRKNKNTSIFIQRTDKLKSLVESIGSNSYLIRLGELTSWSVIGFELFMINDSRLKLKKISKIIETENKYLRSLTENIKQSKNSDELDGIIHSVVNFNSLKREIIYMPTETNQHRIFVPVLKEMRFVE